MSRCELGTKAGSRCKNNSTEFNKILNKNNCSVHTPLCKKMIAKYKIICRKVKQRCISSMTKSELITAIDFAEMCKIHRIRFQKICCKGEPDRGHKNAILYVDELGSQCYNVYKKKYIK
jgi:hypothetical protein